MPSILGNIAEPLITLVAFGYGVGSLIGQIDGLPYIELPGLGQRRRQRRARRDLRGALLGVLADGGAEDLGLRSSTRRSRSTTSSSPRCCGRRSRRCSRAPRS